MNKSIYPCIWFNGNAAEAADLYVNTFPDCSVQTQNGMVSMLDFAEGRLMLLNGGPHFRPNPSVSLFVRCNSAEEATQYWTALREGGKAMMPLDTYPWAEKYAWVEDRYGVNWQIIFRNHGDDADDPKMFPALMFTQEQNGKAEEAVKFYTGIFPNSDLGPFSYYAEGEGNDTGFLKYGPFSLSGFRMNAMDGGKAHAFSFSEGMSIVVSCKDQNEIDKFWYGLIAEGGQESMCGWLKDKYSVSWQIVFDDLGSILSRPESGQRAMAALMKMRKLDIEALRNA